MVVQEQLCEAHDERKANEHLLKDKNMNEYVLDDPNGLLSTHLSYSYMVLNLNSIHT